MAGYDWNQGKSNNAVYAEEEGRYPASVLGKQYGVESAAIASVLSSCEWHHTSGAFNRTYYYEESELIEQLDEVKAKSQEIRKNRRELAKNAYTFYNCKVTWTQTVKDGRRFKEVDHEVLAKKVTAKGSTFTIHEVGSSGFFTKRSCHVLVSSARGLSALSEVISHSVFINGFGKGDYTLCGGESPFLRNVSISHKVIVSLSKKDDLIAEAVRIEKNRKLFRDWKLKALKSEFKMMLKNLFGKHAVLIKDSLWNETLTYQESFTTASVKLNSNRTAANFLKSDRSDFRVNLNLICEALTRYHDKELDSDSEIIVSDDHYAQRFIAGKIRDAPQG